MISHKHKCIFIHIPKTAGSSIEQILDPQAAADLDALGGGLTAHHNLQGADYPDFPEYFKFTVVRNPWDRVVSAYFYDINMSARNESRFLERDVIARLGPTKTGFCEFITKHFRDLTHDRHRLHYIPQYKWINTDGDFDYVCRFENLQGDFNTVCDKIGIPRKVLPHTNKTKHAHYTEYYDDVTRAEVAMLYNIDISSLNYKFSENLSR